MGQKRSLIVEILRSALSTNTLNRFESEVLVTEENLRGLNQLNSEWVDQAMMRTHHQRIILDMDISGRPVHFYNGRGTAEQWIKRASTP